MTTLECKDCKSPIDVEFVTSKNQSINCPVCDADFKIDWSPPFEKAWLNHNPLHWKTKVKSETIGRCSCG